MNTATDIGWPERPARWPDLMTDIEVAQYLRLDDRTVTAAKCMVKYYRQRWQLPDRGRIGGRILFNREAVMAWAVNRSGAGANRLIADRNSDTQAAPSIADTRGRGSLASSPVESALRKS